jgi:hypothetical protein
VDDNNLGVTGPNSTVIPDAVAEFTLQTNRGAETGHSSGGRFNLVIKTGTNTLHGSAYEYFQNRNLNAMDNLTKEAIAAGTIPGQPVYDNNRFGANLGGPIIKSRMFFFGNYEYTDLHGAGERYFPECPYCQWVGHDAEPVSRSNGTRRSKELPSCTDGRPNSDQSFTPPTGISPNRATARWG